jgi:hypothetical protein
VIPVLKAQTRRRKRPSDGSAMKLLGEKTRNRSRGELNSTFGRPWLHFVGFLLPRCPAVAERPVREVGVSGIDT